jgi:hypothetical protein
MKRVKGQDRPFDPTGQVRVMGQQRDALGIGGEPLHAGVQSRVVGRAAVDRRAVVERVAPLKP